MLDDDIPPAAKLPPGAKPTAGPLEGQAGCIVIAVPLAVAGAAYAIFEEGVRNDAAWPAAAAIWALTLMAIAVVAITARGARS